MEVKHAHTPKPTTPTTLQKKTAGGHVSRGVERVVSIYNNPTTNLQHADFNSILDETGNYVTVDLLQHLPDWHLSKRLALQTSSITGLPASTVFLSQLGVFSSFSCRKWIVSYEYGGKLPIGLYVIAEQPSGTGKSRCLSIAEKPFRKAKDEAIKSFKARFKALTEVENQTEEEQAEIGVLNTKRDSIFSRLSYSNATPEALEASLSATFGFFSAISSEQGLFNSLLGLSYGKGTPTNNDILLNGFDGGYVSTARIGRQGYCGNAIGGAVLFAQQGSVEKALDASNGTGLSERFLMLCEPHSLGKRDHLKKVNVDESIAIEYANACKFAAEIFSDPLEPDCLNSLMLSEAGHRLVNEFRNTVEPHLIDGGRYSHLSIRSAAAKADMQIFKLAANLFLIGRDDSSGYAIPDNIVASAIAIIGALLEANLMMCRAKGIIGAAAEFSAVLAMFEQGAKPQTARQIIQSRSRVEPFKSFTGNKSKKINETLSDMVRHNLLTRLSDGDTTLYILK